MRARAAPRRPSPWPLFLWGALLFSVVGPAWAQEGGEPVPLTKSDLTRMLVGTTYGSEEVARIVRRSCLSFEPTERDLQDLRRVGATDQVVEALDACLGRSAPLTIVLATAGVTATAGNVATVQVQLRRGEEPAAGLQVVLDGSEGIVGGTGTQVSAITDADGRATLRVPAGTAADRSYALQVDVPGERVEGRTDLVLAVQPAAPQRTQVAAQPSPPPADAGAAPSGQGTQTGPAAEAASLGDPPAPRRAGEAQGEPSTSPATGAERDATVVTALGRGSLRAEEPSSAVARFRRATEAAPEDGRAWLDLGRALAAAGETGEARRAFRRAAEVDPSLEPAARAELARLPMLPPELELSFWGGASFEDGSLSELLSAEVAYHPLPQVRLFARYDGGLDLDVPALVRGRGSPRALSAGGALRWGDEERLATMVEAGRREGHDGLIQYTYRVQQWVPLDDGPDARVLELGGYLGRWFDRDDWLLQARLHVPVQPLVTVRPALSIGETVGTAFDELGRRPARELRGELGAALRPAPDVVLMPALSFGLVEDLEEDDSGSLIEARIRAEAALGGGLHLQGFLRHQRPPFSEPFTSLAAGLRVGVDPIQ